MPNKPKDKLNRNNKSKKVNKSNTINTATFRSHDHVGLVKRMTTPDNQIFTIVQSLPDGLLQQTGSFTNGAVSFTFSQLSQYTSFSAVFDQYRIEEVQAVFRPMFTANQVSGSSTFYIPIFYVVIDYDDTTALTTAAQFLAYSNCNTSMYETVSVCFRPHIAVAAYAGAFTSYANAGPTWIDAGSPGVNHYGIKFGMDAGGAGQTSFQSFSITFRMRLSLRNVR